MDKKDIKLADQAIKKFNKRIRTEEIRYGRVRPRDVERPSARPEVVPNGVIYEGPVFTTVNNLYNTVRDNNTLTVPSGYVATYDEGERQQTNADNTVSWWDDVADSLNYAITATPEQRQLEQVEARLQAEQARIQHDEQVRAHLEMINQTPRAQVLVDMVQAGLISGQQAAEVLLNPNLNLSTEEE